MVHIIAFILLGQSKTCYSISPQKWLKWPVTNISEDTEKMELLYTVGDIVKWCSHCGKQYGVSSKNNNKKGFSYDPEILLWPVYLKKTKLIWKDMYPMCMAALLTIGEIWKQPKSTPTD